MTQVATRLILATFCALFAGVQPAAAQVPVCQALTLYGNAASESLCKTLSPGTQNLWVCALGNSGVTDVHTTFNAATALHLTVRDNPAPPGCEGNSTLAGTWPAGAGAGLVIAAGQQGTVCQVDLQNYIRRLNAVTRMAPAGGQSLCRSAFLSAGNQNKISQPVMQSYLNLCNQHMCP